MIVESFRPNVAKTNQTILFEQKLKLQYSCLVWGLWHWLWDKQRMSCSELLLWMWQCYIHN